MADVDFEGRSDIAATSPRVSVILPAFNAQEYLHAAIESMLCQTLHAFELIAIDDGSTDQTRHIIEKFAASDARVRVVSRPNRGLVASLNEGIELARGDWIARMDADDVALPTRLQEQLDFLEETQADLCGSWIRCIGEGEGEIIEYPESMAAIRIGLLFGTVFAHPTVMIRTHWARRLRYDPQWEKCEDYELWQRAEQAGAVMGNIPRVLLLYRRHAGQISSVSTQHQQMLAQQIRRRAWDAAAPTLGISLVEAHAVLSLRDEDVRAINMAAVDRAFDHLLAHSQDCARGVAQDHITRLYFRAAPIGVSAVDRWRRLLLRHGIRPSRSTMLKMWIVCLLRLPAGSPFYAGLQTLDRRIRGGWDRWFR